jgi:hypothetical protein
VGRLLLERHNKKKPSKGSFGQKKGNNESTDNHHINDEGVLNAESLPSQDPNGNNSSDEQEQLVEPGFQASPANGTSTIIASDSCNLSPYTNVENHCLLLFTLQELQSAASTHHSAVSPITPLPPHGNSSTRTIPNMLGCVLPPASTTRAEGTLEVLRECAAVEIADAIFDPQCSLVDESDSDKIDVFNSNKRLSPDASPSTFSIICTINGVPSRTPLRVLFDTGSTLSYFYRQALPQGTKTSPTKKRRIKLLDSFTHSSEAVTLDDIVFPELSPTRHVVTPFTCCIAERESSFDIIFGRDFLTTIGIDTINSRQVTVWGDCSIPYKYPPRTTSRFRELQAQFFLAVDGAIDDDPTSVMDHPSFHQFHTVEKIMESKHEQINGDDVVSQQHHLSSEQLPASTPVEIH